jgi:hypothetical protein
MTDAPEEPRHPRLHRLYRYWQSKCRDGRLPARADFDPLAVPYVLGDIVLVDVLAEPPQFRFRLIGTNIIAKYGVELTGKPVEDFPEPEARAVALARCREVMTGKQAIHSERRVVLDGRTWSYSALWLPFATDGSEVDMILCAQIFD